MSKRIFAVFFAAFLLFVSPLLVYADAVMGNEFQYKNRDKTEPLGDFGFGKVFVVNSPAGYIIPRKEPGSVEGISTNSGYPSGWGNSQEDLERAKRDYFIFLNGEIIRVVAIYLHTGDYWGIMSPGHIYQPPGWVLMDDLLMIYQQDDFERENEDDFYAYTGSYDAVLSAKMLVQWEWPGSDREKRIVDIEDSFRSIHSYADVHYAYMDQDGREWGKSVYSNKWICLTDPENRRIPAFYPAPDPVNWSHGNNSDWSSAATIYPPVEPLELPSEHMPGIPSNMSFLIIILLSVFVVFAVIPAVILPKNEEG